MDSGMGWAVEKDEYLYALFYGQGDECRNDAQGFALKKNTPKNPSFFRFMWNLFK